MTQPTELITGCTGVKSFINTVLNDQIFSNSHLADYDTTITKVDCDTYESPIEQSAEDHLVDQFSYKYLYCMAEVLTFPASLLV